MASLRIGIVMDALASIKPQKDSSVAMMLAAQELGAHIFYMGMDDLFVKDGQTFAHATPLYVSDHLENWYVASPAVTLPLTYFTAVLMRKDPPVDTRFIHACQMLDLAARAGVKVVNNPRALMTLNEKLYATQFPDLCPATLISSNYTLLDDFRQQHKNIILKPLDAMGGAGVFMMSAEDVNFEALCEMHTLRGTYPVIAQAFLPAIHDGDARIVVINGKAFPYVLVRTPKAGSIRGNIAAGGNTQVRAINKHESEIVERVSPSLIENGIALAGLDIIGGHLIEINITSPTGLRQIEKGCGQPIVDPLMKQILGI